MLKQPRPEVVLVVSRAKLEDGSGGAGGRLKSRTESVETIVEGIFYFFIFMRVEQLLIKIKEFFLFGKSVQNFVSINEH